MPAIDLAMVRADQAASGTISQSLPSGYGATTATIPTFSSIIAATATATLSAARFVTSIPTPTGASSNASVGASSTAANDSTLANPSASIQPLIAPSSLSNVTLDTIVNFSTYMMLQGFFLGTACFCMHRAFKLFLLKRNDLTFSNVIQLLLWLTRNVSIIVFNIAPGYVVNCSWRQIFVGAVSSSIIVCVWWLQFIKFQSMYKDRVWVVRAMYLVCFVCLAATFPYIKTTVKLDSLDHCSVTFDSRFQAWFISSDVIVNVLLSALFGAAIWKHISNTDNTWDGYRKLRYVFTCDVRAAFFDAAAQLVKLALNVVPGAVTPSQTVLGSHICDWIKVASAHWFVVDVVENAENRQYLSSSGRSNGGGGATGAGGCGPASAMSLDSRTGGGGGGGVTVSIRRKASIQGAGALPPRGQPVLKSAPLKDVEVDGSNLTIARSRDTLKDASIDPK